MRPRYTAALVLVGWYLMAPPMYEHHYINLNAPISSGR
jgi:hypothetical protein